MLVIKDSVDIDFCRDITKSGDIDKILFFDIETTGFSRKYNHIYLIGCMYFDNGRPFICQYFAGDASEESIILREFYKKIKHYSTIIQFNGASFDLPFIEERGRKYNIDFNFSSFTNIDIYKIIKKYDHILKLENLKQKTLENFLSLKRTDPFSGGELIEVYDEYKTTGDERLLKALLLHNMEDVYFMGKLLDLLSIDDLMHGEYDIAKNRINEYTDYNGNCASEYVFTIIPRTPITFPLSYKNEYLYIASGDGFINISVPVYSGVLKYFFDNYKDYYYFPDEDAAMHKDVALYADKSHRKKATASTCYTKKSGLFLPYPGQKKDVFPELFKTGHTSKLHYIDINSLNDKNMKLYLQSLLSAL